MGESDFMMLHGSHILEEIVSEKVVLSGEGADELFGGYNIYREPLALQKVAWIPEKIRRAVSRQAKKLPDRRGKSFLIRAGQRVEERFIGNAHIFTDEERPNIQPTA